MVLILVLINLSICNSLSLHKLHVNSKFSSLNDNFRILSLNKIKSLYQPSSTAIYNSKSSNSFVKQCFKLKPIQRILDPISTVLLTLFSNKFSPYIGGGFLAGGLHAITGIQLIYLCN